MNFEGYLSASIMGIGSYMLAAFVGKPIIAYRDLKAEIARCLVLYANADSVSVPNDPLAVEAGRKFRELASSLTRIANEIPLYGLWAMIRVIPSLKDLEEAKSNLIGLSNAIGVQGRGLENSKRYKRIRDVFGIVCLRRGTVMIAAIYARKSTEQNGIGDEEKSVTRQIEHAKVYAIKKGWTVSDDLIFIDDGISGAEFVKRPGFIRLMNALKPKPSFHVLVMSEESRMGRESIETSYALKQIIDAGVRLFFYLEDRERTLESAIDKVMLSLTNFASEVERERAKQRTYDAMLRKAKAGHVTGGKVYGYENKEILSDKGERLHVVRVVNDTEAAMVRQIFEMYAGGLGITRIAKRLNEQSTPTSPG